MKIIDVSFTLDNDCMTCGTPWHEKVKIEPLGTIDTVGRNTSRFVLGSHSATHMDSPKHFIDGKYGVDKLDLEMCVGAVTCIDFRHIHSGEKVTINDVEGIEITKRMLFVFGWYKNWKKEEYYKGVSKNSTLFHGIK